MVKINPRRDDLVPGFSGPAAIFRNMGLSVGQKFSNKHGTKLIIESANFSDKWYVQRLEDTNLEEKTESILSDIGIGSQYYEKQFHPHGTSRNYRIDFAISSIRLAIEPHASYLWDVNDGQEEEKEKNLNEIGWDVLWLDEEDLEDKEKVKGMIIGTIQAILSNIKIVDRDDGTIFLRKVLLSCETDVTYQLNEEDDTVVYDGEVVPGTIAELDQRIRDTVR